MGRVQCPRPRVSSLMEAIAALAILLAFGTWRWRTYYRAPIFDVVVVVVAGISLFVIGCVLSGNADPRRRSLDRWRRRLGILNGLIALWFVSVDWSWFFEECPNCRDRRQVVEYRIGSIVVEREVSGWFYNTAIERVAADLGVSCSHGRAERSLQQRWRGLCLPGGPDPLRLSDSAWYPPCARDAVRSWLRSDPNLAREFRQRVLDDFDRAYWRRLVFRMYDACPASELPRHPLKRDALELQDR